MVAAAIRQAFLQPDAEAAHQTWRHVADQLQPRWPKLTALMDDSEHDVLTYITLPTQHRTKLHSANLLERLNEEVKRRADVVGTEPDVIPTSRQQLVRERLDLVALPDQEARLRDDQPEHADRRRVHGDRQSD